jgi:hypothetical protein
VRSCRRGGDPGGLADLSLDVLRRGAPVRMPVVYRRQRHMPGRWFSTTSRRFGDRIVGIVRACRSSFCRTWKRRRMDASMALRRGKAAVRSRMEQSVSAGGEPMLVVRRSSFGCLDRALAGVCVAGEHQSEVSLLQGERSSVAPPVRDLVDATPHDLVLFATVPSADRRVRVRGGVEALL